MAESFNPYLKWLGIPLNDQPPNHYRLLGIPELMDDADVISNSADRQMGHVRNFASGQYAQLSQKLLNEIAAAKVCLLTPAKKETYDRQLRSLLNANNRPVPETRPLPQAQPVLHTRAQPQATALPSNPSVPVLQGAEGNSVTQRVKKKSSAGVLIAGVLGLLLVGGVAAWSLNRATTEPPEENIPPELPVAIANHTDEDAKRIDDKAVESKNESEPDEERTTPTKVSIEQIPEVTSTQEEQPPANVSTVKSSQNKETPTSEPKSPADATGGKTDNIGNSSQSENSPDKKATQSVNLLKQIDLERDKVEGVWTLTEESLISPNTDDHDRLMLPGPVPKEYVLEMEVERLSGEDMLLVGLLVGGRQVELFIDLLQSGGNNFSSFIPQGSFPQHRGLVLKNGRPSRIRCQVTDERVEVSIDGKTILDARERLDEMALISKWAVPKGDVLLLGGYKSSFRYTKLELTPREENTSIPNQETTEGPPSVAEKLPLPVGPELQTAQKNLSEIFQDDLADAKSAEKKRALAQTLLKHAKDDSQSSVEKFVLLKAARSLAISGADSETAMATIDHLDEHFKVAPLELKAAALTELSKSADSTEDQMALIVATGEVVKQMIEAEQFDQAVPLTKLAQSAAIKTRNADVRRKLAASMSEFDDLRDAYRKLQPHLEKLKQEPDDPEANLAVGHYRAFVQGNWPVGLKHLAASSDEALRDVAAKDLVGAENSAEQMKIGDAWWDAAEAETGDSQTGSKLRAGFWYRRVLPSLTGLTKEKILKRLDEIRELSPAGQINPKDWELWIHDGQHRFHDYKNKVIVFDDGQLSLANDLNNILLLVYQPFVSDGPCLVTMEIKGPVYHIGLINVEQLSPSIVSPGLADQQWHTVTLERLTDKSVSMKVDDKRIDLVHWRTDKNLTGKIAIWVQPNQTCSIRRFEITTTPAKR